MLGEFGAEPVQQALQPRHDIGLQPDRFGERHPHPKMRGVRFRCNGLVPLPERLIQPQNQPLPEAAGQRRARQMRQIGNA